MNKPTTEIELTQSDFTNRIFPKEGIEIRITDHFLSRWNSRLNNRSPNHFNNAIENQEIRLMCRTDDTFHFLYRDEYGIFFVLIVGLNGGIKTILTEDMYRRAINGVNLSPHKESFLQRDRDKKDDIIQIPKVQTKNDVDLSEYRHKIATDAHIIKSLQEEVNELKLTHGNLITIHEKRVAKLKKQLERQALTLNKNNNHLNDSIEKTKSGKDKYIGYAVIGMMFIYSIIRICG